jgi:hypothetical protein
MADFLTRDNKQLREQIFEFLKVSGWLSGWVGGWGGGCLGAPWLPPPLPPCSPPCTFHNCAHSSLSNNNPCACLPALLPACLPACPQDPLFAPNYHLPMPAFRELTSRRVQAFVDQRMFSVFDYVRDPLKFQVGAALGRTVPCCAVAVRGCAAHAVVLDAQRVGALAALARALAAVVWLAEFGAHRHTQQP